MALASRLVMGAVVLGFALGAAGCASAPALTEEQLQRAANPDRISARLMAQRYLFDDCRKVYGSDELEGVLRLRFKVHSDGSVSLPHIFEQIGQSAALDRCLTDAALKLLFDPMPPGIVANIEYPIQFKRAPSAASNARKRPRPARVPAASEVRT